MGILGNDFRHFFYLAARQPLDPYGVWGYVSPPWLAVWYWPLGLLPLGAANLIHTLLLGVGTAYALRRLGGNGWSLAAALTSAPFLLLAISGNVDWLVLLGFALPAEWGLPLLLTKPQAGGLAGLVWLKRRWREAGWSGALRLALPSALLLTVSLIVWGWWPGAMWANALERDLPGAQWNVAPWPWLVLPGLWLGWQAWKREDEFLAATATLFLTPYIALYSVTVWLVLGAARSPRVAWANWAGGWLTLASLAWARGQVWT